MTNMETIDETIDRLIESSRGHPLAKEMSEMMRDIGLGTILDAIMACVEDECIEDEANSGIWSRLRLEQNRRAYKHLRAASAEFLV